MMQLGPSQPEPRAADFRTGAAPALAVGSLVLFGALGYGGRRIRHPRQPAAVEESAQGRGAAGATISHRFRPTKLS